MLRDDVAAHYRAKGYRVRVEPKLRAPDGGVLPFDVMAQGPLGDLVIDLDDGDGLNLASLRRKAKELGVTPVLAMPAARPELRQAALRAGVVLLEASELTTEAPVREPLLPKAAPWPAPARPGGTEARPVPWPGESPPRPEEGPLAAHDVDVLLDRLKEEAPARPTPPARTGDAPFWRRRSHRPEPMAAPTGLPAPPEAVAPAGRQRFAWLQVAAPPAPEPLETVFAAPPPHLLEEPVAKPVRPEPQETRAETREPAPPEAQPAPPARRPTRRPARPRLGHRAEMLLQGAVAGAVAGLVLFGLGFAFL